MSHGRFLNDMSDDDSAIDVSELPSEYRVKLNGFLRSACNDGHETLARVLLDKGADVNYITTNTQLPTALHVAVCNTRERILPILLPQASNATIQAALQYAIQYRSRLANIIRILQQDGATIESSDNLDKDLDKNAVESPKKPNPPEQKESETQTNPPSQQENETQTNGDHTRQQSDLPSSSLPASLSSPPLSLPVSPPSPDHDETKKETREEEKGEHQKHDIDIQRLQHQLEEQQKQLLDQQNKLRAQEAQHEDAQRKAAHAQHAVEQAQRDLEDMRAKLQKQEELVESQNKQVQQFNEQITAQEAQAQAQGAQLATQVDLTQRLTDQLATHEGQTQKLSEQVKDQLEQIEKLKKRIEELEGENRELGEQFQEEKKKSEAATQEFQAQIATLQKDIEMKTRKIENVSQERDSERKAKEIAKRILSSNGPRDAEMTLGHSHAIRMASAFSPTPPLLEDEEPPSLTPLSPSLSLSRNNSLGRSRGTVPGTNGFVASPRSNTPTDADAARRMKEAVARVGAKKLGSRSRAKDDMDIASEADRARVRRLVDRWEEMKFLEIKR